jgi:hypothetical protein
LNGSISSETQVAPERPFDGPPPGVEDRFGVRSSVGCGLLGHLVHQEDVSVCLFVLENENGLPPVVSLVI